MCALIVPFFNWHPSSVESFEVLLYILFTNYVFKHISNVEPFMHTESLNIIISFKEQFLYIFEDILTLTSVIFSYILKMGFLFSHWTNVSISILLSLSDNEYHISKMNLVRDLGLFYSNALNLTKTVLQSVFR